MTAIQDQIESCDKGVDNNYEHKWKLFEPKQEFYYRLCLNCNRKQYEVDDGHTIWYDMQTKSYIDKYGTHCIKDFDGYEE